MPKIVDHEQRRRLIVETYRRLVAEKGFHHVTAKSISASLGMSTGSLWHYFESLDDVMDRAAMSVFSRQMGLVQEHRGTGLEGLCTILEALLPLDRERGIEAELTVAFWGRLSMRESIREYATDNDTFLTALRQLISEAVAAGELAQEAPVEALTGAAEQLLDGAQVAHALDPDQPFADRRARVAVLFTPWLTDRSGAPGETLRDWLAAGERS